MRYAFLHIIWFVARYGVRVKVKAWQDVYKNRRPNSSVGRLTPSKCVKVRADQQAKRHSTTVSNILDYEGTSSRPHDYRRFVCGTWAKKRLGAMPP